MERERKNLPLWKFAAAIPFPQSNISRIEQGLTEPRIGLVMQMLNVLDLDTGAFMRNLTSQMELSAAESPAMDRPDLPFSELATEMSDGRAVSPAAIFGILLKNARVACHKTQLQVAEAADYTTRSLISVEKGRQEPGLTSALRLVAATGIGVKCFFEEYGRLYALM